MRFFAVLAPVVAAFAAFAAAGSSNPIQFPYSSTILHAGDTINIKWDPTTQGTVSLQLRNGPSNNLDEGYSIASGLPNSGSFRWTIPASTKYSAYYSIEISSDTDPSDVNYSAPFPIQSSNMAHSLSQASASMGYSTLSTSVPKSRPAPTPTRAPRPHRADTSSSKVVLLPSSMTQIPTGAAQPLEVRGVAAALAFGAGVAFAL